MAVHQTDTRARELRRAWPVRTGLSRLLGIRTEERETAWWLGRLPDGWHVFHDIPVGERGSNIDHVIVGPGGVFTVNAKDLTGTIWVASHALLHNGRKTSYLSKSVAEAKRASRRLTSSLGRPVAAYPILAILADEWTVEERPTDVLVDAPRGVKSWLLRRPATLSSADVVAVSAAVSEPSTWRR